jgi:CBS domain containing-hemolysin-like protein
MFTDELPRILQLDMIVRIVAQFFLFAASAFFSGSETALFSLSRFDLQRLSRSRSPASDSLHALLEQPRRLIVSILCGNELVNIAAAANLTAILVELVGVEAAAWTATVVMIPLILLLGEVTPKTIAVTNPVWASTRIVAAPISVWVRLITPLALVVRTVADRITTLIVGPERAKENILHLEELQTLVEEGIEAGEITATERALIDSLISAGATEVREIMTPRSQVAFIDGASSAEEIRSTFIASRRTRVPVFHGNRDNVVGFLYVEDMLTWNDDRELSDMLHPPLCVAPTREVDELLDFLEEREARAALVVSEFGSVDGIVTLSDVTSFLFAGVFEDAATSDMDITPISDGFEMDGATTISAIRKVTGLPIHDTLMTTIAGKALRQFGRVPEVGDQIDIDGLVLTVIAMDGLRIARIRLERNDFPEAAEDEAP